VLACRDSQGGGDDLGDGRIVENRHGEW
jgi:hypothetical protein